MYSSVKAALDAIEGAERLISDDIANQENRLHVRQIVAHLGAALDKVMAEGAVYDPHLGSLAIKQAQGDLIEAAFLLRAYRSTLPRLGYTIPSRSREMRILRRVSSAYQDVPGGQLLGRTRDYSLRLLDFSLDDQPNNAKEAGLGDCNETGTKSKVAGTKATPHSAPPPEFPCVIDYLREDGYVAPAPDTAPEAEPFDVTREPLRFPARRSARLQVMARGESGALLSLGYAAMRGYGESHAYLSEVRVGDLPVSIAHPITGKPARIGWAPVTEAHVVFPGKASLTQDTHDLTFGYGITLGRDERKAISMGIIDENLSGRGEKSEDSLTQNEEFVLNNVDCVDAAGFVEHLKMPHYVSFQADIHRTNRVVELVKAAGKIGR